MAKKSKWKGAALSLLGSIPFVGKVKKGVKAAKKAAKTLQKKAQTTKKKFKAVLKKGKNKVKKKKKKKKKGKVFTKARKLMNNLSKEDMLKKLKKGMKKTVLAAKKAQVKIVPPTKYESRVQSNLIAYAGAGAAGLKKHDEGRYTLSLDKYQYIKDPVGQVYTAWWVDSRPNERLPILMSKQSSFFGDDFVNKLSSLQYRKGIDVTQLEVRELDKIYEEVHNDKLDMISAGAGAAGTQAIRMTKSISTTSKNLLKSKWWHPGYVDNLSSSQILLGVKQSGKGLSTLGSATRSDALDAGKAWVGKGAKEITENGQIIGYSNKERAFRLQYKQKEGMWRANFQENSFFNTVGGQKRVEIKNVHIDILD